MPVCMPAKHAFPGDVSSPGVGGSRPNRGHGGPTKVQLWFWSVDLIPLDLDLGWVAPGSGSHSVANVFANWYLKDIASSSTAAPTWSGGMILDSDSDAINEPPAPVRASAAAAAPEPTVPKPKRTKKSDAEAAGGADAKERPGPATRGSLANADREKGVFRKLKATDTLLQGSNWGNYQRNLKRYIKSARDELEKSKDPDAKLRLKHPGCIHCSPFIRWGSVNVYVHRRWGSVSSPSRECD